MKRVLITGMSGTGKSSVIAELAARGYQAHDLDTPEWSEWVDADPADTLTPIAGKDWVWRTPEVQALLCRPRDGLLFVSGCSENMGDILPLIDGIILLSAPVEIVMAGLAGRSGYGAAPEDRAKTRTLIETLEPRLRMLADHEIDTRGTVATTVDMILSRMA